MIRLLPIGVGRCSLERSRAWSHRLSVLVDHVDGSHVVLLGVSEFDVANRTLGVSHVVGDTLVALCTNVDRPID